MPAKRRFAVLTGAVLAPDNDAILQQLVRDAATAIGSPAAAVSLVLERTVFLRAHFGLAGEMATSLGADRDASYCQFVVRDAAPVEVNDSLTDERFSRGPYECFGTRAYLGMPIAIRGVIVGSLCVFGPVARDFSVVQREALAGLASLVSNRLEQLAAARASRNARTNLVHAGSHATFAELRNVLAAMTLELAQARVLAADVAPLARLVVIKAPPEAFAALDQAVVSMRDLEQTFASLDELSDRVTQQVAALESVASPVEHTVLLPDAITGAVELAHHALKLIGGVRVATPVPVVRLCASRSIALLALSAALTRVADRKGRHRDGLDVHATSVADDCVHVVIETGDAAIAAEVCRALASVLAGETDVRALAAGTQLCIGFVV